MVPGLLSTPPLAGQANRSRFLNFSLLSREVGKARTISETAGSMKAPDRSAHFINIIAFSAHYRNEYLHPREVILDTHSLSIEWMRKPSVCVGGALVLVTCTSLCSGQPMSPGETRCRVLSHRPHGASAAPFHLAHFLCKQRCLGASAHTSADLYILIETKY